MTDVLEETGIPTDRPRRSRRRWPWAVAGAAVIGVVVLGLLWFEPHKLFIDERVDEAIPAATPELTEPTEQAGPRSGPGATPPRVQDPAEPLEIGRGEFVSLDHGTTGVARVLELADGRRIVRLEGLDTDNGPDLYLYLTTNPTAGEESAFDDDFVNLGRLKGNLGDQNYDLAADTDLTGYTTVVIWCDRFNSAFGAADLIVS